MQNKKRRIRKDDFIIIHYWMKSKLNLKGNELYVYAIIYGFSKIENQYYTGGLQYLADWTNSTKQGISKNLKSLLSKGLIEKKEKIDNGVRLVYYRVVDNPEGIQQSLTGAIQQSLTEGIQQSLMGDETTFNGGIKQSSSDTLSNNNISNNINNNISSGDKEVHSGGGHVGNSVENPVENPDATARNILELYNSICQSLPRALRLNDKRRKAIHARLKDGYTVDDLKKAFELAEASPFLRGEVNTSFHADIDWILSDTNLVKILENKYKARSEPPPEAPSGVDPDFLALFHQIGG